MIKSRWFNALAALLLAIGLACSDDSTTPTPPQDSAVKNLNQKSDVLHNFEYAYNARRPDVYEDLLASKFVFFLTPGDVYGNGLPELWDRATDLDVHVKLFDKNYAPLTCQEIDVDVRIEDGVTWSEVHPQSAPAETWYVTTLYLTYRFKMATNYTYLSLSGAKAQFTIRDAGPFEGHPHHWQLVELKDLSGSSLQAASAAITENSTLGKIESLYLEGTCLSCACKPAFCPNPDTGNLSQREYVLADIEAAYNQRRGDWYDALLDGNFTFFLSTGDINNGLPAQWDRATEAGVHTRLFDPNDAMPAQDISLDILTGSGVTWVSFNPASAPSETWFTTTLFYDFRFEIAPNTYIAAPGARVQFTVRDAGPDGIHDSRWQLVEMRDLGGTTSITDLMVATNASTWGQIKALYR